MLRRCPRRMLNVDRTEHTLRSLAIPLFGALSLLCMAAVGAPSQAADSRLAEFIGQVPVAELVPGADRYGPVEGAPPVVRAFAGEKLAGYVFVNSDWVNST